MKIAFLELKNLNFYVSNVLHHFSKNLFIIQNFKSKTNCLNIALFRDNFM